MTKEEEVVGAGTGIENVTAEGDAVTFPVAVCEDALLPHPGGQSLVELLTQGATSGDATLLETAFSVQDPVTVRSALRRLPTNKVLAVLDALVERISKKPVRALRLLPWLEVLLQEQASYLLTVRNLDERVRTIKAIVESRTRTYVQMMQLKGRLDLVLASAKSKTERGQGAAESKTKRGQNTATMQMPLAAYDDSDGDEIVVEENDDGDDYDENDSNDDDGDDNSDDDDDSDGGDSDDDDMQLDSSNDDESIEDHSECDGYESNDDSVSDNDE